MPTPELAHPLTSFFVPYLLLPSKRDGHSRSHSPSPISMGLPQEVGFPGVKLRSINVTDHQPKCQTLLVTFVPISYLISSPNRSAGEMTFYLMDEETEDKGLAQNHTARKHKVISLGLRNPGRHLPTTVSHQPHHQPPTFQGSAGSQKVEEQEARAEVKVSGDLYPSTAVWPHQNQRSAH